MLRNATQRRAAACVAAVAAIAFVVVAGASAASAAFPHYNHVFLLIEENHNYNQIIGNPAAPEINALAKDYGLATRYSGVADPSEPNYVAMLGGSAFGINSDEPYFWPGHIVQAPNLMSQIDEAGLTWKGYFQGMPYPGYRGYCFPAKCNGIPDSDTQYVAKHNGIVNFKDMQTPSELAKMNPYSQLASDLASGNVTNFSYIVADECHDMHGAPPWCVDSGKPGSAEEIPLEATGDAFAGKTVQAITSSPVWKSGNNAIVITFDEGNFATDTVPTIVITSKGPRGVTDNASYNHYSLLASIEQAFGLGCLQNSCTATPMTPLFEPDGSTSTPALPAPFTLEPDGTNSVSPTGAAVKGKPVTLGSGSEWEVVPARASAISTTTWRRYPPHPRATRGRSAAGRMQMGSGTRWPSTGTAPAGRSRPCLTRTGAATCCMPSRRCRAGASTPPGKPAARSRVKRSSSTTTARAGQPSAPRRTPPKASIRSGSPPRQPG